MLFFLVIAPIVALALAVFIIALMRKKISHKTAKKILIVSGIVSGAVLAVIISTITIVRYCSMRGSCGNNLSWVYDGKGTLTISGTGKMYDYGCFEHSRTTNWPAWTDFSDEIDTIIIEDGVRSIGSCAFCRLTPNEVYISDSVTAIGDYAFYQSPNLTELTIPDKVTHIGDYAFSYCSSLERVDFPDNLESMGRCVFDGCESLNKVVLPQSLTHIDHGAFAGCTNLTEITLPQDLETIGGRAFLDCTSLSEIEFPASVTLIEESAFSGCTNLSEIRFYCDFPFDEEKSNYVFSDVTATAYIDSSVVNSWYGHSTYYLLGELDWVYY